MHFFIHCKTVGRLETFPAMPARRDKTAPLLQWRLERKSDMNSSIPSSATLLPFREGLRRLGLLRGRFYDWSNKKSKRYRPDLPKRVKIGASNFFLEEDIERFIRSALREN
jgi:prophage regulatory protein